MDEYAKIISPSSFAPTGEIKLEKMTSTSFMIHLRPETGGGKEGL
jgi:hypothetical protein